MKKLLFVFIIVAVTFISCNSNKVEKKRTPQELIKLGLIDEAKREFMMPSDINSVDEDGNSVLHLAAMLDDEDLVTFLIIKGANTELKNYDGDTPLLTAIRYGATKAAAVLSQVGGDLFARDAEGITALDLGLETDPVYYDKFITTRTGEIRDINGQSIVHYFVKTKDIRAIQTCINKKINISVQDNDGKTPLDIAFENVNDYDSVEIAATLILGGADEIETDFSYFQEAVSSRNLNTRFDDNQTPLHLASMYGHKAIAQYLLENNANTNVQDSSGSTPLHEAVRYGKLDIAKMLLDSGANVNAQDNIGKTPIMIAMPKNLMEPTYRLLISYRANLLLKDSYGDTVIHTATMLHVPASILETLSQSGIDIDAKNKEGVTAFEIAIQHGDLELTKFFAKHKADIHTKDRNGNSPLTMALAADDVLFETTVSRENVQSQDSDGNTPLHIAILSKAPLSKIQYIISLTDDVNIRNSDGNSALYLAIKNNQQQVGQILLQKNADIFSANKDNDSPLRIALRTGGRLQDWLITSKTIRQTDGSGNSCLHYAAEWQYKNAINSLLEKGADPKAKNSNGETVLFSAVKTNNPEIIDLVIKGGTPINARDNLGSTALHMAARWDAAKSIEKLLSYKVDINAQNTAGKSALAESALSGKFETAKILLNNGADVNSSDKTGCTILMDAIKGQNKEVVQLLLSYKANVGIQEINGRNAFHEAALTGDINIITMIQRAGGNPLSRDKAGNTPFSIVLNKNIRIIKAVLGTSTQITDSDGNTPIHIVVNSKGSNALLTELIKMGYPIDSRNSDGYTALTYAVENGNLNQTTILLENGANPFQSIDKKGNNAVVIALDKNNKQIIAAIVKYAGTMTDIQGNTILHYAAKNPSVSTVKDLLAYGLSKDAKNISGDTPYTIAVRWKRNDIAALLK